jgi:hypothetical protein
MDMGRESRISHGKKAKKRTRGFVRSIQRPIIQEPTQRHSPGGKISSDPHTRNATMIPVYKIQIYK